MRQLVRLIVGIAVFLMVTNPQASQGQPLMILRTLVSPEVHSEGKVTFRLYAPKAERVLLAGSEIKVTLKANSIPLTKGEGGVWSVTVGSLPPGIYEYHFDVDGVVLSDPSSPNVFGNRRGGRSFVEVPGPKGQPRTDEWRDVPHGNVTIHWYNSSASGTRRRLHVYTAPGYGKDPERKYPVLYLQHGSGDTDSHWTRLGQANVIADNRIAEGKAVPMLIVMPIGFVREPPLLDPANDKFRQELRQAFGKDLLENVIPLVESTYLVRTDAAGRAIAGLTMGGAQSLSVGLTHPEKFAWIGSFSGSALKPDDPVVALLRSDSARVNERLKLLWLGIAKEDPAINSMREFVAALKEMGVKHEYKETEGGHYWITWRQYLGEFLPRLFQ